MVKEVIDFLIQHDPEVGNAVKAEYDRTMAAVSAWTWWKTWPVTGQRPSLGLTTPMSSPTAALLPTTQSIRPCVTWVTPSWA